MNVIAVVQGLQSLLGKKPPIGKDGLIWFVRKA